MKVLAAFVAGLLFSIGLVIAGMTRPENIIGFLDFFGSWKPALAFVMAGAVGVYAALYPLVMKRHRPLFAPSFDLPSATKMDARLLIGAATFGVGWGLGGFCPGPALVSLGTGTVQVVVFVAALMTGVSLHHFACPSGAPSEKDHPSCG